MISTNQHTDQTEHLPEIQPVYFPYTFIPESVVRLLKSCVPVLHLFGPTSFSIPDHLNREVDQGFLKLRVPEHLDEKRLRAAWHAFNEWAQRVGNIDLKTAFFSSQNSRTPFFSDSSVSKILADVKAELKDPGRTEGADFDFSALLWIYLAQKYDVQQEEVSRELGAIGNMEEALYQNMTGQKRSPLSGKAPRSPYKNDPFGDQMVDARMRFWSHLFIETVVQDSIRLYPFFITSNPVVISRLADVVPEMSVATKYDSIPKWEDESTDDLRFQTGLLERLALLAQHPRVDAFVEKPWKPNPDQSRQTVSLTIYVVEGVPPLTFLTRLMKPGVVNNKNDKKINLMDSTLIGLIRGEKSGFPEPGTPI